jgi:ribosomal protein S18 acetylase RimI-like enzyme
METADHWASEKGIDQIELSVREFNEQARAFYTALGYRTTSRKMSRCGVDRETATEPGSL